jgi:iron complex outermembrane receptor protein
MAFVIANEMEGETFGLGVWADIRLGKACLLKPGYSYLEKDLRLSSISVNPNGTASEGNDPRHRLALRALFDLREDVDLDVTLRHVSELPNPRVPSYTELDLRVAWRPRPGLELSLVGQNLLHDRHPEFGQPATRKEIQRAGLVQVGWSF